MAAILVATMKSVSLCFHNFRQYPAMDIVTSYERREAKFPKVTICQNSMHSRHLVESKYDFMLQNLGLLYNSMRVDSQSVQHLETRRLAGKLNDQYIKDYVVSQHAEAYVPFYQNLMKITGQLKNITYRQFVEDTAPTLRVFACRIDSKDCRADWTKVMLYDGKCIEMVTPGFDLTTVIGYDKHGWTAGWRSFMDGVTVYYSDWQDQGSAR